MQPQRRIGFRAGRGHVRELPPPRSGLDTLLQPGSVGPDPPASAAASRSRYPCRPAGTRPGRSRAARPMPAPAIPPFASDRPQHVGRAGTARSAASFPAASFRQRSMGEPPAGSVAVSICTGARPPAALPARWRGSAANPPSPARLGDPPQRLGPGRAVDFRIEELAQRRPVDAGIAQEPASPPALAEQGSQPLAGSRPPGCACPSPPHEFTAFRARSLNIGIMKHNLLFRNEFTRLRHSAARCILTWPNRWSTEKCQERSLRAASPGSDPDARLDRRHHPCLGRGHPFRRGDRPDPRRPFSPSRSCWRAAFLVAARGDPRPSLPKPAPERRPGLPRLRPLRPPMSAFPGAHLTHHHDPLLTDPLRRPGIELSRPRRLGRAAVRRSAWCSPRTIRSLVAC